LMLSAAEHEIFTSFSTDPSVLTVSTIFVSNSRRRRGPQCLPAQQMRRPTRLKPGSGMQLLVWRMASASQR
jgi:hypothetical protein